MSFQCLNGSSTPAYVSLKSKPEPCPSVGTRKHNNVYGQKERCCGHCTIQAVRDINTFPLFRLTIKLWELLYKLIYKDNNYILNIYGITSPSPIIRTNLVNLNPFCSILCEVYQALSPLLIPLGIRSLD